MLTFAGEFGRFLSDTDVSSRIRSYLVRYKRI